MPVASGQLPYEYEWPTPFRASNNSDQGLSGIHLEAAQFVIQAEMRKFFALESNTQVWRVFTNESNPLGSGYDPKANGDTLNGLVGPPVQVDLDHISLMRRLMVDVLFDDLYPTILEHDTVSILQDWIRRCYPESPSGYHGPANPNPNFQGQFLRPVLQEDGSEYTPFGSVGLTGTFTDPDPHWLGGSGIILDLDVGEVMWNPYPLAFHNFVADVHGTASNWTITIAPCFPMFQRTNGSLISLNGFEEKWPQDPSPLTGGNNTLFFGFDHVGDNLLKYNTYGLFSTTIILAGRLNSVFGDEHGIEFSPNQLTVDSVVSSQFGLEHCGLLLNPISLPTGLYRITSRNLKADKPFTTIESGVASQWPSTPGFITHHEGYEVFDNCFWVTDWGGKITPASTSAAGPSGFAVVSPFTGRMLWQRNATDDVGGQVWDISDAELKDVRWWFNENNNDTRPYLSLQRVGTNQIVRLVGALEAGGDSGDVFSANVAVYNDDIATVTNETFLLSVPPQDPVAPVVLQLETMVFDGTFHYIGGSTTVGSKTWIVNSSFTEVDRIAEKIATERVGFVSDGLGGPKKFVGFGGSDNISEWEIIDNPDFPSDDPEPETFSFVVSKDLSPPTGQALVTDIYEIIEVEGVDEITDGVYALILSRPTLNTSRRLSIVRIEESTTTWEIRHEFILQTLGNTYDPGTVHLMGMITGPVT